MLEIQKVDARARDALSTQARPEMYSLACRLLTAKEFGHRSQSQKTLDNPKGCRFRILLEEPTKQSWKLSAHHPA